VSPVKGARLGGLLARGLIGGAAAIIVVVGTLLTWPWSVVGPSADEQRIADLQRLSHAIDAFRARQHVLPASLVRLPAEPAAPIHAYDPVTNRPYDYRPLGPLAYELCARFDAASAEASRDFWWHDGGRYCFSMETRDTRDTREAAKPPAAASSPELPAPAPPAEPASVPAGPTPDPDASPDTRPAAPDLLAPSGPPPPPPAQPGAVTPPA
jgi:hypothetical protein